MEAYFGPHYCYFTVFLHLFFEGRCVVQLIQSPDTEEVAANERFNQANEAARKPEV